MASKKGFPQETRLSLKSLNNLPLSKHAKLMLVDGSVYGITCNGERLGIFEGKKWEIPSTNLVVEISGWVSSTHKDNIYESQVTMRKGKKWKLVERQCSCISRDYGSPCKHVVCLLFAILALYEYGDSETYPPKKFPNRHRIVQPYNFENDFFFEAVDYGLTWPGVLRRMHENPPTHRRLPSGLKKKKLISFKQNAPPPSTSKNNVEPTNLPDPNPDPDPEPTKNDFASTKLPDPINPQKTSKPKSRKRKKVDPTQVDYKLLHANKNIEELREYYQTFTQIQLSEELYKRDLASGGTKKVLVERMVTFGWSEIKRK